MEHLLGSRCLQETPMMMSLPKSSNPTAFHLQASLKKGRMYTFNSMGVLSNVEVVQVM